MCGLIAGFSDWLKSIGLLDWLSRLDPLDKWLGIVATVGIGLYAIFHETFWAWKRRPKLEVMRELRCIDIPVASDDRAIDSYYVQAVITNRGKSRAELVEVYAKQLSRQETEGAAFVKCTWFLPMNLQWENEGGAYTGISHKVGRVCSIAGIWNPAQADPPALPVAHAPASFDYSTTCTLRLHTVVQPTSHSNWVFPGSYRLDLVVAAANVKPQEVSVFLKFDGPWCPDKEQMLRQALQVSLGSAKTEGCGCQARVA